MTMKKILSIILIFGGLLLMENGANAEGGWTFSVEPNVTSGSPVIIAKNPVDPAPLRITLMSLALDTSQTIAMQDLKKAKEHRIEFSKIKEKTYIELRVDSIPAAEKPLFTWRTLIFPKGAAAINYKGTKDMLPPPDFDEYWSRAKAELDAVPIEAKVNLVKKKEVDNALLYRVELPTVENTTIVCWYCVPKEAFDESGKVIKKFPAVLIAPGYGAEEPPVDRTDKGLITLSVNPRHHGPSKDFWKSPVEHLSYNITNPEKYYYKLAFLDCLRGAQFLFSRDEVDHAKVATEGGSQGGLLAIATAALEPRIACVCSNVTAFTDYPDGMLLAQIGHHSQFAEMFRKKVSDIDKISKSLQYTDGANLIPKVKCPVQINMGGQDNVCPYICGIVAYNRIAKGVKKEFNIVPNIKHEVPYAIREFNNKWYQTYLFKEAETQKKK